jgi:hypothetical protein
MLQWWLNQFHGCPPPPPPPPGHLLGIFNCTCSQGQTFAFCRLAPGWGICSRLKSSAVQTPVFHLRLRLRLRPNYSSELWLRLRPHHKILNKCFTIREHVLILLWITLFALPNYQIT